MKKAHNKFLPILAVIVLCAVFPMLAITARELSGSLMLQQQVYGRTFVALVLACIVYFKHFAPKKLYAVPRRDYLLGISRGVSFYILAVPLVSYAAIHSTVFLTSVLAILPFGVAFGALFYKEKLTAARLVAMLIAFLGVVVISNPLKAHLHLGIGELAAILSGVLFSLAYVTRRSHSAKISNPQIAAIMLATGTLGLLATSLLLGQGLIRLNQLTGHALLWLGIGGAINTLVMLLLNYVFSSLPAITANIMLNGEFVFAVLLGYMFYGQVPVLIDVIGGLLIVVSVIVLARAESKPASPKPLAAANAAPPGLNQS